MIDTNKPDFFMREKFKKVCDTSKNNLIFAASF